MSEIQPVIKSVKELIVQPSISIPDYQRPYKWSLQNVNQLLDDILTFKDKPAYRLGTIVFHKDKNGPEKLNIVDGQQRTITLLLIVLAISKNEKLMAEVLKNKITCPDTTLLKKLVFKNMITKNNIRDNYLEIERRINDFDAETVRFFFDKCEVVEVVISDISEAFQFFDSQNARGKDLDPHDLLKAFHLREMADNTTELERILTVENWEELDSEKLKAVFSKYLFRIRNWSKGKSARTFSKNNVDVFKGISPSLKEPYPFTDMYRISHFYVNGYNQDYQRNIDQNNMSYPFQVDQIVINGKRFFEMLDHYVKVIDKIKKAFESNGYSSKAIIKNINTYSGRNRTGDRYVRNLFDNALIYYVDKFGDSEIDRAIERLFLWAYSLRLTMHSVQLASIDNYAIQYPSIFKIIRDALKPSDVLNIKIPLVSRNNIRKNVKTQEIVKLFENLKFIYE